MSVHLVGGGWSPNSADVYRPFLDEAAAAAKRAGRDVPKVAIIAVRDGDAAEHAEKLRQALAEAGQFEAVVTLLGHDDHVADAAVQDVDGIVIGGGLTPAYLSAVRPVAPVIRKLVADGVPYLGFSAGSAIAATRAVVGGWLIGGLEVSPEDGAEDLDEVAIRPGLGVFDSSIDVHAAQWGNLSRLIAATEAGLIPGGYAIDENTVLIVGGAGARAGVGEGEDALTVAGAGAVWVISRSTVGVLVERTRRRGLS